jgi:cell division protein FtsN
MDEQQKKPDNTNATQPMAAPVSDPTNPHNQEPAGDWVANARAAERSNNEPGLTDEERKRRRW